MALAHDVTGMIVGATWAAAGLVLFVAWRQRRLALAAVALTLFGLALWAWMADGEAEAGFVLAPLLFTLGLALLLIELGVRALRASQSERRALQQRLAESGAELGLSRQQMQLAQHAAEAADLAKARFLAAASHDLRQPAHALGLYTAALRAGPLNPEQADLAQRMQSALAALDTLFAALLDVSRMDTGAVLPQWDTVALAPLLRRLADEWAPQAEARGLRLALHISEPGTTAVTDPVLLERVLRNLLANAVKYTRSGGILLACRARTAPDGQRQIRIEVWDSGVGIAPSEQARVFEEFFQVSVPARSQDRERDRDHGLGLGLAIVQRLLRLLQLRVALHSRPGRGSVFFVDGLAPAGVAPLAAAAARLEMRRLAGLLVAVLEDDDDVRDAMRRLLQLWECRVVEAPDATALLQRLPAEISAAPHAVAQAGPDTVPDAVVAALRLGGGRTGPAELRRLHAAWGSAVPVLWISGEPVSDSLLALLPAGATVLSKPVSPARLRAWLEQRLPLDGAAAPGGLQ